MSESLPSPIKPALGRTAFITGGAQGIGRAISCRLARDGYDISIADIPSQSEKVQEVIKEIESYGRKAISVTVGKCLLRLVRVEFPYVLICGYQRCTRCETDRSSDCGDS